MFARVSTYQGSPEWIEEAIRYSQEQILPRAKLLDGFKGVYHLVDRQSGKALTIALWESEEAMRASEEAANRLRGESAEAAGEEVVSVERYEVAISPEQQGASPPSDTLVGIDIPTRASGVMGGGGMQPGSTRPMPRQSQEEADRHKAEGEQEEEEKGLIDKAKDKLTGQL